jgi:tRNA(Ile)-lysidine synthase
VHKLAEPVLEYIRRKKLLKPGDRLGVAVSGGADSVALLRLLLDLRSGLGIVLSVVHFNHKLRGAEADADEQFVAELALRHQLHCYRASGDVARLAAERHLSQEAAAREMRYAYFWRLLRKENLDHIATAHTLDDQAETVLLRIVRGAGTRGLAGIYPVSRPQSAASDQPAISSIIRPLLATRRSEIEACLVEMQQTWREDKSNQDLAHVRNRVRYGVLPQLARDLNPAVREVLGETAEIARAEEEHWKAEVRRELPTVWDEAAARLQLSPLLGMPLALQRRLLRAACESLGVTLEFRHVERILSLAEGKPGAAVVLPREWKVTRQRAAIAFSPSEPATSTGGYEYPLSVPGFTEIPEIGVRLEVLLIEKANLSCRPGEALDAELLGEGLKVRNWRAGDRFWAAHTKSPKKVKELLQERRLSGRARTHWPVIVSGAEVVWMKGFMTSARFRPKNGARMVMVIHEIPWRGNALPYPRSEVC